MLGGLGWTEIVMIAGVVIIFLGGGNQLPQFARSLGKALREFKTSSDPEQDLPPDPAETEETPPPESSEA